MNLIEQLGGYEKAKTVLDKAPCKTYTYHNHPYQKGYIRCWGGDGKEYFLVSDIEQALLEYRRQHNIYEAGDLVAYRTLPYERLFSVRYVGGDEIVIYELWDEMGAKTFTEMHPYSDIRHATDAEIEASKRLEVDSE